ncbi:MAG: rhomboid family intramembrane serine protease [Flavobacteriales bacterium]|nr:rhomboid family intramembrane serine protease [Flavobacteriales bacterium]
MGTLPSADPLVVERRRIGTAAIVPALSVVLLWVVHAFDRVYALDLARFGILPRAAKGLIGILVSPFVHADLEHLINNSAPLFVLGWMLVYFYPKVSGRVTLISWLVGGLWVWLTARESLHIGASGIVYGLAAFLFTSGVIRKQRGLMTVSLIIVFLYGSMWWGVLPLIPHMSYESHFFGAAAGVVLAFVYRHVPPAHVAPPIEFPEEEEEAPLEADEVDDQHLRAQRELAAQGVEPPDDMLWPDESTDPFGPAYRSSATGPLRDPWKGRQRPPSSDGEE